VVGVASIGGTLLSARMTGKSDAANLRVNIGAEHALAKLAEKRRNYANCLAALTQYAGAHIRLYAAKDSQGHNDLVQERTQALTAARIAVLEVALIGPESMRSLTAQAEHRVRDWNPSDNASRHSFSSAHTKLVLAMRVDLGEPMV
jgi:hypothetical protein